MSERRLIPYPGLRAFTREESYLFFGRDYCVTEMIDKMADSRFLAVLGSSGSGKSSLVRTGLLEYLELGLHPGGSEWEVIDFHPAGAPIESLAAGLFAAQGIDVDEEEFDLLAHSLRRGPRAVIEWCEAGHLPEGRNLLLLADQFEELFRFSSYAEREEAEAFARLLIESSRSEEFPITVCLTMRTEFLSDCAMIPGLAERINDGLFLTPRMTRDECEEAIVGPAGVAGFEVEPVLSNQLLNDMATLAPWEDKDDASATLARRSDQLPLMQHVLNQLWLETVESTDGEEVILTRDHYQRIGGLTGALDVHGRQVLERLGATPPNIDAAAPSVPANDTRAAGEVDYEVVSRIFRALVAGPSIGKAVRRPCRFDELVAIVDDEAATRKAIDAFRSHGVNFLRPYEGEPLDDHTVVDISHESLIRQWSMLTDWFEEEREAGVAWQSLQLQQEAYAGGKGDLLSGLALANMRDFWAKERPTPAIAARHGGDFVAMEKFYRDSVRQEEWERAEEEKAKERETRRLRVWLAGTAALAIVAMAGAWYGLDQADQALAAEQVAERERNAALEAQRTAVIAAQAEEKAAEAATTSAEEARLAAAAQEQAARRAAESEQRAIASLAEAEAAEAAAVREADNAAELIDQITRAIESSQGGDEITGDASRDAIREVLPNADDGAYLDSPTLHWEQGWFASAPVAPGGGILLSSAIPEAGRRTASQAANCEPERALMRQHGEEWADAELTGSLLTQCLARILATAFEARANSPIQRFEPGSVDDLEYKLKVNARLGAAWNDARNWADSFAAYREAYNAGLQLEAKTGWEYFDTKPELRSAYLDSLYVWGWDAFELGESQTTRDAIQKMASIADEYTLAEVSKRGDASLAFELAKAHNFQLEYYRNREPDRTKLAEAEASAVSFGNLAFELEPTLGHLSRKAVNISNLTVTRDAESAQREYCDLSEAMVERAEALGRLDGRVINARLRCAEYFPENEELGREALALAGEALSVDPFNERLLLKRMEYYQSRADIGRQADEAEALERLADLESSLSELFVRLDLDAGGNAIAGVSTDSEDVLTVCDFSDLNQLEVLDSASISDVGRQNLECLRIQLGGAGRGRPKAREGVTRDLGVQQQTTRGGGFLGGERAPRETAEQMRGRAAKLEIVEEAIEQFDELNSLREMSEWDFCLTRCAETLRLARADYRQVLEQSGGKALRTWPSNLFIDRAWRSDEEKRAFVTLAIDSAQATLKELPRSEVVVDTLHRMITRGGGSTRFEGGGSLLSDAAARELADTVLSFISTDQSDATFLDRDFVNEACRMHHTRLNLLQEPTVEDIRRIGNEIGTLCEGYATKHPWAVYTRNALRDAYHDLGHTGIDTYDPQVYRALMPYLEWASVAGDQASTGHLIDWGSEVISEERRALLERRRLLQNNSFSFVHQRAGEGARWTFRHTENPLFSAANYLDAMDRYARPVGPDEARSFLLDVDRRARELGTPMPFLADSLMVDAERHQLDYDDLSALYSFANRLLSGTQGVAFNRASPADMREGFVYEEERPDDVKVIRYFGGQLVATAPNESIGWRDWPAFSGYDPVALSEGHLEPGDPANLVPIVSRDGENIYYALFASPEAASSWISDDTETLRAAAEQWRALQEPELAHIADRELLWSDLIDLGSGLSEEVPLDGNLTMELLREQAGAIELFEHQVFAATRDQLVIDPARTPSDTDGVAFGGQIIDSLIYDSVSPDRPASAMVVYRGAKVAVGSEGASQIVDDWPFYNGWDPVELADGKFVAGSFANRTRPITNQYSSILFASEANRDRWERDDGTLYLAARETWLRERPQYAGDIPNRDDEWEQLITLAKAIGKLAPALDGSGLKVVKAIADSRDFRDLELDSMEDAESSAALAKLLSFDSKRTPTNAAGYALDGYSHGSLMGDEIVRPDLGRIAFFRGALLNLSEDDRERPRDRNWPMFNGWDPVELGKGRFVAGDPQQLYKWTMLDMTKPVLFASEANRQEWLSRGYDRFEGFLAGARTWTSANPEHVDDILENDGMMIWISSINDVFAKELPQLNDRQLMVSAVNSLVDVLAMEEIVAKGRAEALGNRVEEGDFEALRELRDLTMPTIAFDGRRTPVDDQNLAFNGYTVSSIWNREPVKGEEGDVAYFRGAFASITGLDRDEIGNRRWPAFNGWDPVALAEGRFEAGRVEFLSYDSDLARTPFLHASAESRDAFEEMGPDIVERAASQWLEQMPREYWVDLASLRIDAKEMIEAALAGEALTETSMPETRIEPEFGPIDIDAMEAAEEFVDEIEAASDETVN